MRIDSRMNIKKLVPRGRKREKQNAAMKETVTAVNTANSDRNNEFATCRTIEVLRVNKASKFSSVGVNNSFGGVAKMSFCVLKADRMIQATGAKNSSATAHSSRW